MSIRQVIWKFELNPSKGWGVIDIPREFPFWGGVGEGKGLGQKKFCFVFSGPSSNCLPILKLISPKKRTHRHTHRHTHTDRQKPLLLCSIDDVLLIKKHYMCSGEATSLNQVLVLVWTINYIYIYFLRLWLSVSSSPIFNSPYYQISNI